MSRQGRVGRRPHFPYRPRSQGSHRADRRDGFVHVAGPTASPPRAVDRAGRPPRRALPNASSRRPSPRGSRPMPPGRCRKAVPGHNKGHLGCRPDRAEAPLSIAEHIHVDPVRENARTHDRRLQRSLARDRIMVRIGPRRGHPSKRVVLRVGPLPPSNTPWRAEQAPATRTSSGRMLSEGLSRVGSHEPTGPPNEAARCVGRLEPGPGLDDRRRSDGTHFEEA